MIDARCLFLCGSLLSLIRKTVGAGIRRDSNTHAFPSRMDAPLPRLVNPDEPHVLRRVVFPTDGSALHATLHAPYPSKTIVTISSSSTTISIRRKEGSQEQQERFPPRRPHRVRWLLSFSSLPNPDPGEPA